MFSVSFVMDQLVNFESNQRFECFTTHFTGQVRISIDVFFCTLVRLISGERLLANFTQNLTIFVLFEILMFYSVKLSGVALSTRNALEDFLLVAERSVHCFWIGRWTFDWGIVWIVAGAWGRICDVMVVHVLNALLKRIVHHIANMAGERTHVSDPINFLTVLYCFDVHILVHPCVFALNH